MQKRAVEEFRRMMRDRLSKFLLNLSLLAHVFFCRWIIDKIFLMDATWQDLDDDKCSGSETVYYVTLIFAHLCACTVVLSVIYCMCIFGPVCFVLIWAFFNRDPVCGRYTLVASRTSPVGLLALCSHFHCFLYLYSAIAGLLLAIYKSILPLSSWGRI